MCTERENSIGYAPLKNVKDMKKNVPRGELNHCSFDGMLVARWKDKTILSAMLGIKFTSHVRRYDEKTRENNEVQCLYVIIMYNG